MKCVGKTVQKFALLAAVTGVVLLTGCATVEQNMAEQSKLHLIPGKEIHATGPNYEFCEVAPIYGTSMENAVADFYNPTGIDHCSPEQFAQIEKDKEKIIKEMGAREVFLNPSRHWTWDELWVYQGRSSRRRRPQGRDAARSRDGSCRKEREPVSAAPRQSGRRRR